MTHIRLLALPLLLSACMPTAPTPAEGLRSNRSLWEERQPPTYEFILRRSACECPPEWLVPTRVTVHEGQIRSAENAESGALVPAQSQHVMSIDGLFALVESAFDQDAFRVSVLYDLDFGYPNAVFIDYDPNLVDDQVTITARELKAVD